MVTDVLFCTEGKGNMDNEQPLLPLDERFRNAEQFAFDFGPTQPAEPPKTFEETNTCGKLGYCYYPKCNPR